MRVWVLTNGYGEDRAGAAIARELLARRSQLRVAAATLVTPGDEFRRHEVPLEVAGRPPRSGGFPAAGLRAVLGDLPALPGYFAYLRQLRRRADGGDEFVAIGDVFLTGLARMGFRKPGVHVALPKSVHGRRHSRLERALLKRWTRLVFARDEATAADLQGSGVRAVFVGNPLIDGLQEPAGSLGTPARATRQLSTVDLWPGPTQGSCDGVLARVLLLPGSRDEASANLTRLLGVVLAVKQPVAWACAWSHAVPVERAAHAAVTAGWQVSREALERDGCLVALRDDAFEALLSSADIVVGLAGTANEQAAAMGKPVVTFVGCGPQTTMARMREQERLLGGAAQFVRGDARAVAAAIARLIDEPEERRRRGALGIARLGACGGAGRIADAIIREFAL